MNVRERIRGVLLVTALTYIVADRDRRRWMLTLANAVDVLDEGKEPFLVGFDIGRDVRAYVDAEPLH